MSRSYVREIIRNIIKSLTPRNSWGELRGTDYMGTKYYEAVPTAQSTRKRPNRWFVPAQKENFEQDIPPEWMAWLRHRRKDPPTEEEIQTNILKMMKTIENAKKLEKPKTVSKEETKSIDKPSFPVYEEYKLPLKE